MRRRLAWAGGVLAAAALGVLTVAAASRTGLSQGYVPAQPIAYSHKVHAGDYRIPCLYCHFAAESSRHAGIPPTSVCMSCHARLRKASAELEKLKESFAQGRPIRWVKVHNLPDFVYFSHGRHVLGGIACQRCHGPVETMERVRQHASLTMGWCIDCHRREGTVPPAERTVVTARTATGGLDCAKCHY